MYVMHAALHSNHSGILVTVLITVALPPFNACHMMLWCCFPVSNAASISMLMMIQLMSLRDIAADNVHATDMPDNC